MLTMKKLSLTCMINFAVLLALLGGCATRTPLDVGQVVVAPQVKLPPPPVIVQVTQPKPAGYFQQSLLDYFNGSSQKPTPSTMPTPAAGQTPTQ
jgi:hypothetical protein